MENTVKFLFDDDATPKWYVAMGTNWVGPLTASDVYEKIMSQELTWAHYVWKPGQSDWKRACDVATFQAAVPHQPGKGLQGEIKAASSPVVKKAPARPAKAGGPPPAPKKEKAEPKIWYLHYNDSQFGPFSGEEVDRYLKIGKIHGRVHAWRDGLDGWERLEKIGEFTESVAAAKRAKAGGGEKGAAAKQKASEQRKAPRQPLVARILLANDESVIVAVCRDISVGGMQVLTDRIPGPPGIRLKMNVSPSGDQDRIQPFVAEGVIVRILEDGRGFSFRFERLPDNAKRAIENHIRSQSE